MLSFKPYIIAKCNNRNQPNALFQHLAFRSSLFFRSRSVINAETVLDCSHRTSAFIAEFPRFYLTKIQTPTKIERRFWQKWMMMDNKKGDRWPWTVGTIRESMYIDGRSQSKNNGEGSSIQVSCSGMQASRKPVNLRRLFILNSHF